MINVPVIARRELNTYFLSLLAYFLLTLFALLNGLWFAMLFAGLIQPNMLAAQMFQWTVTVLVFVVPMITARLLSEETGSGTVETLLTAPVSDAEVVLGKYVGALIFCMAMLALLGLEFVCLATIEGLDYGPVASGFLGLYLVTAQFLAIGLFCSSLSRFQTASGILTFVILIAVLLLGQLPGDSQSALARALLYMSPPSHLEGFFKGIVDTRDLVYFAATGCMFLFLTAKALESRRWR